MSEEMQPIDPITAAMLMGQVPEPCEPITEISHKVLTKLLDVVEFGDQLERVEKDRLLAHLKEVLAAEQPQLWAMHSLGPGEVHPMISKEAAEQQAAELIALCNERCPTVPITVNVIPSPFSPLEHFEILASELNEQVNDLSEALENKESEAVVKQHFTTGHNIVMPAGLHPDTQDLVTRFATALAVKLHAAELKHGYSDGWKEPDWMDECRQKLLDHLAKGDPRDVAAYCAFLWHHCQSTSPVHSEDVRQMVEPVTVTAVAVTRFDEEEGLYLDWLLEGGIAALELPGQVLLVADGKVTDDEGHGEIYLAPAAKQQEQP